MAYQPQVPTDTLSSAARGYKQFAKLSEVDGLGQIQHESAQAETTTQRPGQPQGTAERLFGSSFFTAWCRL